MRKGPYAHASAGRHAELACSSLCLSASPEHTSADPCVARGQCGPDADPDSCNLTCTWSIYYLCVPYNSCAIRQLCYTTAVLYNSCAAAPLVGAGPPAGAARFDAGLWVMHTAAHLPRIFCRAYVNELCSNLHLSSEPERQPARIVLMRPATRPAYASSCSTRTNCCTAAARAEYSAPSRLRLRRTDIGLSEHGYTVPPAGRMWQRMTAAPCALMCIIRLFVAEAFRRA